MKAVKVQKFFRAKKKKGGGNINWQAKKAAWIATIEKFYKTVTTQLLEAPIKAGDLEVAYSKKTIVEEFIGSYEVRELELQVGDERVFFSPKGRNIVGASGRIDLIGERGERTLVVLPKDRWGIVVSRSPILKIIPLDENSLLEALKDVMRP